jgi:hypothetical protein
MTDQREKKSIIDNVKERLFSGRYGTLENIKFFRGPQELISVEDLHQEVHSALVQREQGRAKISKEPAHSSAPSIDVREYVSKL